MTTRRTIQSILAAGAVAFLPSCGDNTRIDEAKVTQTASDAECSVFWQNSLDFRKFLLENSKAEQLQNLYKYLLQNSSDLRNIQSVHVSGSAFSSSQTIITDENPTKQKLIEALIKGGHDQILQKLLTPIERKGNFIVYSLDGHSGTMFIARQFQVGDTEYGIGNPTYSQNAAMTIVNYTGIPSSTEINPRLKENKEAFLATVEQINSQIPKNSKTTSPSL